MRLLFIRQITNFFAPVIGNGMGIVATIANQLGHEVKVVDNNSHYRFYTDRELIRIAESYQPDVVAFNLTMFNARYTYTLLSKMKKRLSHLLYLGGGIHMRHSFEEALRNGLDMVVNHEGELVIGPLLEHLKDKSRYSYHENLDSVPGVSFLRKNGELHRSIELPVIENLDDVPFIDYDLFNLKDYFKNQKEPGVIPIVGQRGCPFLCTFCSDEIQLRDRRVSSGEYMFRYAEYVHRKYGQKYIVINDNNFTFPRERAVEFCNKIITSSLHGQVKFSTQTKIETPHDSELLKLMREAGVVHLGLGLERMESQSKKMIKKTSPKKQVFKTLDLIKQNNIPIRLNGMLGFPFETESILLKEQEAFLSLASYAREISFSILAPVPGTIYYDYPKAKEWYLRKGVCDLRKAYFSSVFETSSQKQIDLNIFDLEENVLKRIREIFFSFKQLEHAYYMPKSFTAKLAVNIDKLMAIVSRMIYFLSPSLEFMIFRKVKSLRYYFGTLLFGDKIM